MLFFPTFFQKYFFRKRSHRTKIQGKNRPPMSPDLKLRPDLDLKSMLVVPDYIHIRRNLGFGVLTPVTVATNRLSATGTCTNCFWVSKMLFSRKTCAGVLRTGHRALVQQHTLHVVHLLPACICISINLDQEDFLGLCWRIILAPHLKPGKQAPWNIDGSLHTTHPQTIIPDSRLASPA